MAPSRVAEAFAADRKLLEDRGYSLDVDLNRPGYIRAIVRKRNPATKIEWAHDPSWRFMPTVRDERVGFVLHPVDLAVNKVLALAGRDEVRDVLDTVHYHRTGEELFVERDLPLTKSPSSKWPRDQPGRPSKVQQMRADAALQ